MTKGKFEKGPKFGPFSNLPFGHQMNGKGLQHLNNPLFSFDPTSNLSTNQMRVKIDIVDSIDRDHWDSVIWYKSCS